MSIYDAENNTLTDLRDNQIYKTVTIGEQIWMAENLNYMPEDTVGTIYSGGTVCGGGAQNSKEDSEKCDIFGRLYLRKVALNKTTASNRQGICPDGWSIPKKEDWEKLISHLGENVVLKIKGDSWESTPGTNESGFSAIPAGNYNNSVIGYDNLSRAYFFYWNSKSDPYFLRIRDEENDLYYSYGATYMMYSVRCIKE
ncbi:MULTISPECIES: FISUMP domain-containing protein [unclassified Fibrobacter]|uniref:FISUMP domain-containing protein n=1 Tax=unclassified Fibrobacter TaxID=2634177 RepID=UPI00130488D2|nr:MULTISPECIES: FISUMP domain-containing protein [unclassified Fibrobacter]